MIEQGLGQLNEYLQSTLPVSEGVYEKDLDQKLSDVITHYNSTAPHHSLPDETVLSFWKKYCHTRRVGGLELADLVLQAAMKKTSPPVE